MSLKKKLFLFLDLLGIIALILLDQYTKYLAVIHLKDKAAFNIINGVLELNYLENTGAAFGMLQNQKAFFIFVAIVILSVIAYVLFKTPDDRKYTILHVLLSLIAAGAIGNMIDRIRYDYVVDFIYFVLINFPIFNVADIYVSISTAVLIFLLLFYYKEKDLNFISFKQKHYREIK
ncbi:MAG: signal peptidase II [Lachnospiraceae bacterium]|nr:signal peptidase II [Lachnospiraceae bacterium]